MSSKSSPKKDASTLDVPRIQGDLDKITVNYIATFGEELGPLLEKEAKNRCIPHNSMVSVILILVASLIPGLTIRHGSYLEAVVFHVDNMGESGINKSGITNLVNYLLGKVCRNLKILSQDYETLRDHGISISTGHYPILIICTSYFPHMTDTLPFYFQTGFLLLPLLPL